MPVEISVERDRIHRVIRNDRDARPARDSNDSRGGHSHIRRLHPGELDDISPSMVERDALDPFGGGHDQKEPVPVDDARTGHRLRVSSLHLDI
jgi:hypothetical protein